MQPVLSWDNARAFLLVLFAPTGNPRRVFESGWGVNARLLLWAWLAWLPCGWPSPVALPRQRCRALYPTPPASHMGRKCPGAAPSAPHTPQATACAWPDPQLPSRTVGLATAGSCGNRHEAGEGEAEAGELETTLPAQERRSAQTKNYRPLGQSRPVAASSCAGAACKCHRSPAPRKPACCPPRCRAPGSPRYPPKM